MHPHLFSHVHKPSPYSIWQLQNKSACSSCVYFLWEREAQCRVLWVAKQHLLYDLPMKKIEVSACFAHWTAQFGKSLMTAEAVEGRTSGSGVLWHSHPLSLFTDGQGVCERSSFLLLSDAKGLGKKFNPACRLYDKNLIQCYIKHTGWFWRAGNFCSAVPVLYFVISLDKRRKSLNTPVQVKLIILFGKSGFCRQICWLQILASSPWSHWKHKALHDGTIKVKLPHHTLSW